VKDGLEEEVVPPPDPPGCPSTTDSCMIFTPFLLSPSLLEFKIASLYSIRISNPHGVSEATNCGQKAMWRIKPRGCFEELLGGPRVTFSCMIFTPFPLSVSLLEFKIALLYSICVLY
jgi:hypothetical protein